MTKKVITAEDIIQYHKQGKTSFPCHENTIITALAQDKADELGISIDCGETINSIPNDNNDIRTKIKNQVLAQLPKDLHQSSLIDGLIEKLLKEKSKEKNNPPSNSEEKPTASIAKEDKQAAIVNADTSGRSYLEGIIAIDSQKLPFQKFDEAPCDEEIKIIDVITDKDNSPMGVGYLAWNNASFDWHLDYDEVDIILEGELHVTINKRKIIGKVGDCIFIPKNTSINFSSSGNVKFAYVTYPANWS